jgi:uncharacterized protein YcfL
MKRFIALIIPALLLAACGDDGVPKVEDPHNIVVDGQPMTQAAFIEKYCAGKADNATCMTVLAAKRQDSTRGKEKVKW